MPPRAKSGKTMGRRTFAQQLEGWKLNPQGFVEMVEKVINAETSAKASIGFQWNAPSTIDRRDRHLKEYEGSMEVRATQMGKPFDDEYLWGACSLEENIRFYLEFAATIIEPQSYTAAAPRFGTLVQRRQSMLFWMQRNSRGEFHRGKLYHASQEALRHAARSVGLLGTARDRLYLTKYDLVMLMEYDMSVSQSPQVAEQHHLCWLFGFVLGVRPGTIGFTRKRLDEYLQWKDVKIMRWKTTNFRVRIVFRWLKGYRDDERKALEFNCVGPRTVEEAMYSIPHRILAIALRRGILADYDTLDELLKHGPDALINIKIKDDAQDSPVILAVSPKGLDVLQGKPAGAAGISEYVQRVSLSLGFPAGITHYAWRRSAATNMSRELGENTARDALGHAPDSRALETHYKLGVVNVDFFGISMGGVQATVAELLEDDSLGITRIKTNAAAKANWIRKYINQDVDYSDQQTVVAELKAIMPEDPSEEEVRKLQHEEKVLASIHRTLRRRGQLAFHAVETATTKAALTESTLEERRLEMMKPGKIQAMLLEAAKKADPTSDELHEDNDTLLEDLADVRDIGDTAPGEIIDRNTLHPSDDLTVEDSQSDIAIASRLLMEILTGKTAVTFEPVNCNACLDDDTMSEKAKARTFMPGKLKQHLATDTHSPKAKWIRAHKNVRKCPWGCNAEFSDSKLLLRHARGKAQTDDHLLRVAKEGIFALDFAGSRANRNSQHVIRMSKDKNYFTHEDQDPTSVALEDLIAPATVAVPGPLVSIMAKEIAAPTKKGKTVLRLPTKAPIVDSAWYIEHSPGFFGAEADALQDQQKTILKLLDASLRALNLGQALQNGQTRQKKYKSDESEKALVFLRGRLVGLKWAWSDGFAEEAGDDDIEGDAAEDGNHSDTGLFISSNDDSASDDDAE